MNFFYFCKIFKIYEKFPSSWFFFFWCMMFVCVINMPFMLIGQCQIFCHFFVAVVVVACIIWFHRESWWCFLLELFFLLEPSEWMSFGDFPLFFIFSVYVYFLLSKWFTNEKKNRTNYYYYWLWQKILFFWVTDNFSCDSVIFCICEWKKNWISKMMMIMMAGRQAGSHTHMHACMHNSYRQDTKKKMTT